jgi:hypothetical protein
MIAAAPGTPWSGPAAKPAATSMKSATPCPAKASPSSMNIGLGREGQAGSCKRKKQPNGDGFDWADIHDESLLMFQ